MAAASRNPDTTKGDYPWWLVALVAIGLALAVVIAANEIYAQVFGVILQGLWVTIFVTVVAFVLATLVGLGVALLGLSDHAALRQVARFYTEVIRGVPILVLVPLSSPLFIGARIIDRARHAADQESPPSASQWAPRGCASQLELAGPLWVRMGGRQVASLRRRH